MMFIKVELRNSYSRDGIYDVCTYEDALEMARNYVRAKTDDGICAYADIRTYFTDKTGYEYLDSEISIKSDVIPNKWNPNGTPIVNKNGCLRKRLFVYVNKGCNKIERLFKELDLQEC